MGMEKIGDNKIGYIVTFEGVLNKLKEGKQNTFRYNLEQERKWLGHVTRGSEILTTLLEGAVEEKRR